MQPSAAAPFPSPPKVPCVASSSLPENPPPHCIHGPTVRFERGGCVFYACSVERDGKGGGECGFRHNVTKDGEVTAAKAEKWKAREEGYFMN